MAQELNQLNQLNHLYGDIDGVRLHWVQLGQQNTESAEHVPIVLLHGLTDSHLTWRAVAAELAVDHCVLAPDLPGCGLSERPNASYRLQWHAHVIARWLERLDLRRVDVVGHSFGGGVAQMLLLECPERIRRIVLVASGGLGRDVGFWLKFATFPHFVEHYGQAFMPFGTRRALGHVRDERTKQDVRALSAMNAKRGTARAFSRTVRDVIGFRGQTRLFLQRAHEIAAFPPIAVLWGEADKLIPVAHGRAFTERMEGVRFQSFPECGHYVHQERPAEVVAAIRDFLDDSNAAAVRLRPGLVVHRPPVTRVRRAFGAIRQSLKRRSAKAL